MTKPKKYRDIIDALVDMCHNGQGQISSKRLINGVWNINAQKDFLPDHYEINLLLQQLSFDDRVIIAKIISEAVETGVFETLKILEENNINPFETGYEGSSYNDFIGRLSDWEWPES